MTESATNPQLDRVREKMAELEEAINTGVPGFAFILKDIHECLRQDPDVVTILSEDELAVIVKGLEKHSNETIVSSKAKAPSRTKAAKGITASDL